MERGDRNVGRIAEPGGHPGVGELAAYHGGSLGEGDEERIQDHLATCRECTDALLDLDSFIRVVPRGTAEAPSELERAASWRALRQQVPRRRPRSAAAGIAAALALLGVALATWAGYERHLATELRERLAPFAEPQANLGLVELFPPSAVRGEGGSPAAELPAGAPYTALLVHLPRGRRFASYRVEIAGAAAGRPWVATGVQASDLGTVRLGIPAGSLPAGEGELRLFGEEGAATHKIETYRLRVPRR